VAERRGSGGTQQDRVTVVIPSWNGRELLERVLLPSLARQHFIEFRILLVDNGSTDGSVEVVRNEWPHVEVIELTRNLGFAAAVNRGIEQSTSEFVALVNNDVELDPDWLTELVRELDSHPEAASATGKIRHFDERDTIYAAGDELTHYLEMFNRGRNEPDRGQYDTPEDVLSGCGAATLYRRVAFDVVGVFDEDFFAYAEDVDWGLRAQLRGMTCRYVPSALSYHLGGATNERVGIAERYTLRNSLWLAVKTLPARILIRNLHRIAFVWARAMFRWTRDGGGRHALWAGREAVAMLPVMLAKRRAIRADVIVSDAYVESLIAKRRTASAKLDWLERLRRRVFDEPRDS
jgi:GT2 family glycosyltransferase